MATRTRTFTVFNGLFFAAASGFVSADTPTASANTPPSTLPVVIAAAPDIRVVLKRAPNGQIQEFEDSAKHAFLVRYRDDRKVESVSALRGRHASDIDLILYAPTGEILHVEFGNGYSLTFINALDHTQIIRDQYGGVATRSDSAKFDGVSTIHSDPSKRLQSTLKALESLLATTSQ